MIERAVAVEPFLRVQYQQLVDEVEGVWVLHIVPESFLDLPILVLGELHLLKELQLVHAGPHLRGNGATQLADEGELLLLCVPLHHWPTRPHLGHDAPGPPHVDGGAVVPRPEEELRGPVPEGDDPVGVALWLLLALAQGPGESKVGQLEGACPSDEDVGGLHVPVENVVAVDVEEGVEQLLDDALDLGQGELDFLTAQESRHVVLAELQHQIYAPLVSVVRCG